MTALRRSGLMLPVAFTVIAALLIASWQGWTFSEASRKLPDPAPRGDYEVVLAFAPEAFHMTRLQDLGRVTKVEGPTISLHDVRAEDARALARNYWVVAMRTASGG